MHRAAIVALALALVARSASAQSTPKSVDFELMTWPEVASALAAGKTTALFYTGGTEQRGPQNVNGGHTLMGKATVRAIAVRLGNAIAMPVLPTTSTSKRKPSSTNGSRIGDIRRASMRDCPTRRRCCISAATAGCAQT